MDLGFFVTINYAPCIGILFMFLFLQINGRTDKVIRNAFLWLLLFEFVELVVYSLELVTAMRTEPSMLRILLSAIGYTLRPVLVYLLIRLNVRDKVTHRKEILVTIPLMLNAIAAFSAFFTDVVYSYTAENQFVRGPLGYTSQIITGLYLIVMGIIVTCNRKKRAKLENAIVFLSIVLIMVAMVVEALYKIRSLGHITIVMTTIFYYMYFQSTTYQDQLDVEKHRRLQLQQDSNRDKLTGLLNKIAFTEQVDLYLEKNNVSSALLFFDLDHFKDFNDTVGHLTGDELLKEVAGRLNRIFRSTDVLGRFGGDEFYVYMPGVSYSVMERKSRELLSTMQITWDGVDVDITVSIGVCYVPSGTKTKSGEVLRLADKGLYEAKHDGRNCYRIHTVEKDN